jgi:hypothetical protein
VLRSEAAWDTLPQEKREELYGYLPPVPGGFNTNVNPLKTALRPLIEEEIRRYQNDLNDGKEVKKWREDAMKAGKERSSGSWNEFKEKQLEEDWGKRNEASARAVSPAQSTEADEQARVTGKEAREEANKSVDGTQS